MRFLWGVAPQISLQQCLHWWPQLIYIATIWPDLSRVNCCFRACHPLYALKSSVRFRELRSTLTWPLIRCSARMTSELQRCHPWRKSVVACAQWTTLMHGCTSEKRETPPVRQLSRPQLQVPAPPVTGDSYVYSCQSNPIHEALSKNPSGRQPVLDKLALEGEARLLLLRCQCRCTKPRSNHVELIIAQRICTWVPCEGDSSTAARVK